jgi:hypothetical protein
MEMDGPLSLSEGERAGVRGSVVSLGLMVLMRGKHAVEALYEQR